MDQYEFDYEEYAVQFKLRQEQIEAGVKYGVDLGMGKIYPSFDGMVKEMNQRGLDGWHVKSAWQRDDATVFLLAVVWQRKLENAHN